MKKRALVDKEFLQKVKKIEEFCERSTDTGGVLLVTGPRGVGKTRLVDEALNRRHDHKHNEGKVVFNILDCDAGRSRKLIVRQPNQLKRYLIKVIVDPNFPYPKERAQSGANKKEKSDGDDQFLEKLQEIPDENDLTYLLLRNIVFGLTSSLDSRTGIRRYGKTLRAKLGWREYWFAKDSMICHQVSRKRDWWLLYAFLVLVSFCVMQVGFFLSVKLCPEYLELDTCYLWYIISLLLSFANPVFGFAFLRWLDWRALHRFSSKLFAQVNASDAGQNYKHTQENKREMGSKIPFILTLFLLALVLISDDFVPTMNVITLSSSQEGTESAGERPGTLKDHSTTPALINRPGVSWQDRIELLILFLLSGSFVVYYVGRILLSNREIHSAFDQGNPVWLVSLIRSYLFLCHRCGIEPVLVLDELDKLVDLDGYLMERKRRNLSERMDQTALKNNQEPETVPFDKLDFFLVALARLKSSLGAEFLWILISGPALYERLQIDRHERSDRTLGLFATVIHQEISLGPVSLEASKQLLQQSSPKLQGDAQAVFWLRARGVFATMIRMIEAHDDRWTTDPALTHADELAKSIDKLWDPNQQKKFLDATHSTEYHEKLHSDWVQTWIRVGMMDFGNRLLLQKQSITLEYIEQKLGAELKKRYKDDIEDNHYPEDISALLSGIPTLLLLLGERLLYAYLNRNKNIDKTRKSPYVCLTFNRRSGSNEL